MNKPRFLKLKDLNWNKMEKMKFWIGYQIYIIFKIYIQWIIQIKMKERI